MLIAINYVKMILLLLQLLTLIFNERCTPLFFAVDVLFVTVTWPKI